MNRFSPTRLPVFYGWVILVAGCLTTTIAYGVRGSFSVFYVAILDTYKDWSRAETALIFSAGIIVYGITAPISGALVDRFGPRRIMPVGCLLVFIGTAASSQAHAIWQFCLFFALLAMGACLTAYVPFSTMLANWFHRRRATAFGIFSAGSNFSLTFLLLSQLLIASFGWRNAYLYLSALVVLVLLPLVAIVPRHRPSDLGQYPDGVTPSSVTGTRVVVRPAGQTALSRAWASHEWSLGRALRTYRFWALFLANMSLWGLGNNLLQAHQVAYAVDIGFSATQAASMAIVWGIGAAIGASSGGGLADRHGREPVFTIGVVIAIAGVGLLALTSFLPVIWLLYGYALVIGLGIGLANPAQSATVADLFAGRNFGAINGAMVMGFGVGGSLGPWIGGLIFDHTRSYLWAFAFVACALLFSIVCIWITGPRYVRPVSRA